MKTIKTKQSLIERNRTIHLQIGLVLALAAVLMAFEWKTWEKSTATLTGMVPFEIIEDLPMITLQRQPPPPPPSYAEIKITLEPEIEIPDFQIDVSVDFNIPEIPYIPPALPEEPSEPDDTIYRTVEVWPSFPGGEAELYRFLGQRLRYPSVARETGITGIVYVTFVVERDGSITGIQVVRGGEGGLGEETIRVLELMPDWNPGIQGGRYVRVQYIMPVRFSLQ